MDIEKKIKDILIDYQSRPNKDLEFAMAYLNDDFEETKKMVIKLTHHMDATEKAYEKVLNEYKKRTKK